MITIEFDYLDIEPQSTNNSVLYSSTCDYDYLAVYNGNTDNDNVLLQKYCASGDYGQYAL